MRKLLLASAAVAAGSLGLADIANAQLANVYTGPAITTPPVYNSGLPSNTPGPGSISVRLRARVVFNAYYGTDSGRVPGPVTGQVAGTTAKISNYDFGEYARLFPGFDGIAGNGLRYGAAAEIRQDNSVAPGGGGGNFGSVSSSNRARAALYWRREYGYVGADNFGFVRFGSVDGPSSNFLVGTFENFDDGGFNGDLPGFFSGNTAPTWPFGDVGALYTASKVVYVSPGFDVGVGRLDFSVAFEPNTGAVNGTNGNCGYAQSSNGTVGGNILGGSAPTGCDATSSSANAAEVNRRRNTVDGGLRYRGSFGPVGITASATYITSGKVLYNGAATGAPVTRNGLNVVQAGATASFGGFAAGGAILSGQVNGQWGLQQKGQIDAFAYILGGSYATGPFIVGAHYLNYTSAGSQTAANRATTAALREGGIAAGGTYTFAPGANLFLSYLYAERHEPGVDLLAGATGSALHNHVKAHGVTVGTLFQW